MFPGLGFGDHVVGVPADWNEIVGVWVHFGGSYGKPYNPNADDYATRVWIDELLAQHWFEADGEYTDAAGDPIDGHAASVGAPDLATERAQACFRDQP